MVDFHTKACTNEFQMHDDFSSKQLELPFGKSEKEELQERLVNGFKALTNLIVPPGESKERAKQASSLCYELHTNFFKLAQILPSNPQKAP